MAGMREAIVERQFPDFRAATMAQWDQGDLPETGA